MPAKITVNYHDEKIFVPLVVNLILSQALSGLAEAE